MTTSTSQNNVWLPMAWHLPLQGGKVGGAQSFNFSSLLPKSQNMTLLNEMKKKRESIKKGVSKMVQKIQAVDGIGEPNRTAYMQSIEPPKSPMDNAWDSSDDDVEPRVSITDATDGKNRDFNTAQSAGNVHRILQEYDEFVNEFDAKYFNNVARLENEVSSPSDQVSSEKSTERRVIGGIRSERPRDGSGREGKRRKPREAGVVAASDVQTCLSDTSTTHAEGNRKGNGKLTSQSDHGHEDDRSHRGRKAAGTPYHNYERQQLPPDSPRDVSVSPATPPPSEQPIDEPVPRRRRAKKIRDDKSKSLKSTKSAGYPSRASGEVSPKQVSSLDNTEGGNGHGMTPRGAAEASNTAELHLLTVQAVNYHQPGDGIQLKRTEGKSNLSKQDNILAEKAFQKQKQTFEKRTAPPRPVSRRGMVRMKEQDVNREINTVSPGHEINTSSPRKDINTCSPRKEINTCSPRKDINTSSPRKDINTSSPRKDINTSSPRKDINTSSPRNAINTNRLAKEKLTSSTEMPVEEIVISSSDKGINDNVPTHVEHPASKTHERPCSPDRSPKKASSWDDIEEEIVGADDKGSGMTFTFTPVTRISLNNTSSDDEDVILRSNRFRSNTYTVKRRSPRVNTLQSYLNKMTWFGPDPLDGLEELIEELLRLDRLSERRLQAAKDKAELSKFMSSRTKVENINKQNGKSLKIEIIKQQVNTVIVCADKGQSKTNPERDNLFDLEVERKKKTRDVKIKKCVRRRRAELDVMDEFLEGTENF